MAKLWKKDKTEIKNFAEVCEILKPLNVQLSEWPVPKNPELQSLLAKDKLSDDEKSQILHHVRDRFEEQSRQYGYKTQDLVSLTSATPTLEDLLAKFDKIHTHSDDEVRYIIEGSGLFGFVLPNQEQVVLQVEAGEYIRVPANTEHWFLLDAARRIKAVRYFVSPEGWVANYVPKDVQIAIE